MRDEGTGIGMKLSSECAFERNVPLSGKHVSPGKEDNDAHGVNGAVSTREAAAAIVSKEAGLHRDCPPFVSALWCRHSRAGELCDGLGLRGESFRETASRDHDLGPLEPLAWNAVFGAKCDLRCDKGLMAKMRAIVRNSLLELITWLANGIRIQETLEDEERWEKLACVATSRWVHCAPSCTPLSRWEVALRMRPLAFLCSGFSSPVHLQLVCLCVALCCWQRVLSA